MSKFFDYVQSLPPEDALWISSPVNRRYVSNFTSSEGTLLAAEGKILLFLDMRYYEMACIAQGRGQIPPELTIIDTRKQKEYFQALLSRGIRRFYYEDSRITCAQLAARKKAYPQQEFLPLGDTLEQMRTVKSPREVEKIRAAQQLTTAAFSHILSFIREGLTEWDVALELEFYMRKQGAEACAFDTICVSGTKSSLPHGRPEAVALTKNSFLTMDFGAMLDGYCSDMTRTVVLGKADSHQRLIYSTVLQAQLAAIAHAKAGISGKQVDRAAREVIEQAGFGECFTHATGHSLGLEVHESPNFSPRCEDVIPAGAVLSVEPGIYIEGKYGVRIEDMILLTPEGCENLTPVPKELVEL